VITRDGSTGVRLWLTDRASTRSLTGSTVVGREIGAKAGTRAQSESTLEPAGKSPT